MCKDQLTWRPCILVYKLSIHRRQRYNGWLTYYVEIEALLDLLVPLSYYYYYCDFRHLCLQECSNLLVFTKNNASSRNGIPWT